MYDESREGAEMFRGVVHALREALYLLTQPHLGGTPRPEIAELRLLVEGLRAAATAIEEAVEAVAPGRGERVQL